MQTKAQEEVRPGPASANDDGRDPGQQTAVTAPFAHTIGRTRFIVLLAVVAVILVAMVLFVLGAGLALMTVWTSFKSVLGGDVNSTDLTVKLLEVVSLMLKAVVFYIIGVGLYSLFIAPLNITAALGVDTLYDLEMKVVSIIVVIMSVTFLEHFILWENALETLQFGGTLAVVVASLVLFQFFSHRAKEDQKLRDPEAQVAQRQLFQRDEEERDVRDEQALGAGNASRPQ